ncbi:MAG: hypothetical protein HOH66_16085 [Rhodospirillaceae bacterium]|jgi:FAD-dependent urate hydroxylase|nr:hypothetical protein [Rhodospirillaceae bacterium]
MTRHAIICGGGISGLTAGIYLGRMGWDVTVCEKDPELRTAGAGLNLWPNGIRVLEKIGLRQALENIGVFLNAYRTFSSNGEPIAVEDVSGWREKYGAPLYGVHRRNLSRMLSDALGQDKLRLGHELVSVQQDGSEAVCTFGNGETMRGDVVLGADGVTSVARNSVFGPQEFSADEQMRWRGLFNVADADADPNTEVEVWGTDGHFGCLPIGGGKAYWFAAADGLTQDVEEVVDFFGSWRGSLVPAVIAATDKSTIIRNSLRDLVRPLKNWSSGRITLAGDAAHPVLPGMAQGANQALEDVDVLCQCLGSYGSVESALAAYEGIRIAQVAPVIKASRALFDYEGQNEVAKGNKNPLFDRYHRLAERRVV